MTKPDSGARSVGMETDDPYGNRLAGILAEFNCQTGTIHRTTAAGNVLALVCQVGVPDVLLEKISSIPFGKGIAGAAAERRGPVRLCNLQADLGGVAKPDARQTGVCGSLAVPVFSSDRLRIIGTLGIGKNVPYDFSAAEERRLEAHARELAADFENKAACDD
jgi:putative methionine-R-sulfoxide reductase with GAF domain